MRFVAVCKLGKSHANVAQIRKLQIVGEKFEVSSGLCRSQRERVSSERQQNWIICGANQHIGRRTVTKEVPFTLNRPIEINKLKNTLSWEDLRSKTFSREENRFFKGNSTVFCFRQRTGKFSIFLFLLCWPHNDLYKLFILVRLTHLPVTLTSAQQNRQITAEVEKWK